MTQPVLQRNFLSGWRRWVVIALAFGLAIAVGLSGLVEAGNHSEGLPPGDAAS